MVLRRYTYLALSLIALLAPLSAAKPLILNYNGEAVASGSGCSLSTVILTSDSEAQIVLPDMNLKLEGYAGGRKTERKVCTLHFPFLLKAGYKVESIEQSLYYSYERSPQSEGRITTSLKYDGKDIACSSGRVPQDGYPTDAASQIHLERQVYSLATPCQASDVQGNVKAVLGLTAYRQTTHDYIYLGIGPGSPKFTIKINSSPCTPDQAASTFSHHSTWLR